MWAGVLLHPARPWDLRPRDCDDPLPSEPEAWPSVGVVIPARNEADFIGPTLSALDQQDYPGALSMVVIDERSTDITGDVARQFNLSPLWQMALPASGLLYGAMTLDSALRGPRGGGWR